jgi:4-hydroxy-tetrahydrodipicolinate synthase
MLTHQTAHVIVPLVTPSKMSDFFPLVDHVLDGGVKDLVFFGTTGEGGKIDNATKKSLIQSIVPYIGDRARLYIGLLCPSSDEAINLADFCNGLGFEGALLPTHLYGENPNAVVSDFLTRSSANFLLYNPPGANPLGKLIHSIDTNRIIGLKDSSGDIALMRELTTKPRPIPCRIFYGREHLLDKALEFDIDGIFPGTGNIEPELLMRLWQKRDDETVQLFNKLKKQVKDICPENYTQGLKLNLKKLGIIEG